MTATIDMKAVGEFAQQVGGMLAGGATAAMMVVGDRVGLYAAMAESGPTTSEELAARSGLSERYVREWLAQQASVGFVEYAPETGTFTLPPEHAAVLADDNSPASMIGAALTITGMHRRTEEVAEVFRTGGGIPWGDQDPAIHESTERFFRVGYRNFLVEQWIPALTGVEERLRSGATVLDVGCGHGAPLIILAQAFPRSRFIGYDAHPGSVEVARRRVADAGLSDRVTVEVNHCHGYTDEDVDVIAFFDTLHDLGDPIGAAAHARRALADDGTLLLVEPRAGDDLASTLATAPLAPINFAASTFLCTPNSLSQPVGLALGTQAGPRRTTEVLREAGFGTIRVADESDFNTVYEASA